MDEHLGIGPDGSNPLGFLCAVGAFVTLDNALPESKVRMSWRWRGGWRPVWKLESAATDEELAATLHAAVAGRSTAPEFTLGGNENLKFTADEFRRFAIEAAASATTMNRRWADFMAAYGSELATKRIRDEVSVTAFRFTSGQQGFLGFARRLSCLITVRDIHAALFLPWRYSDPGPSMRWDPSMDDRRYALRADDPKRSKLFPIRTVRGANCLAIEALRCFPAVPVERRLETTCFTGRVTRGLYFSWPIWEPPISISTARSLLNMAELIAEQPDHQLLAAKGIAEVFRCRVAATGKGYRNFSPAASV